jgi:outer membrane receptor protein involved in Fe transport
MTMKPTKPLLQVLLTVSVVFVLAVGSFGQVPTAQLTGVVTDPTGAVVPKPNVKVQNERTGIEYPVSVNAEGRYSALALPAGTYAITVSTSGFKSTRITGVLLSVGQAARLDITLELGEVSEQVTVRSEAPLLQTDGAAIGTVVTEKQLTELPLNGRSFLALATLAPGTTTGFSKAYYITGGSQFGTSKRAENYFVQANGIRGEFTASTLDGINMQSIERRFASIIFPSPDMLQEFKAETSNYKSEFSGGGGVVVNAVTKSGTNKFHGSGFEFAQNKALNARNFFQPANTPKPDEKYHQFGFTVGGPIRKDRTFFFVSYQGLRIKNTFVNRTRVPTEKERRGDFSESLAVGQIIRDPETTVADPTSSVGYSRSPFAGNIIPSGRISPIAQKIIELAFPLPTNPENRSLNFQQSGTTPDNSNQLSFRIDHQLTAKDFIFGRWTQEPRTSSTLGLVPDRQTATQNNAHSLVLAWNHTVSPQLLSELRMGFNRFAFYSRSLPDGQVIVGPGGQIPLQGLENIPESQRQGLCCFSISGLASPNFGIGGGAGIENRYQINDKLSWIHGRQTITVGGSWTQNEDYGNLRPNLIPTFSFGSTYTANPFGISANQNYDTGLADFLLGLSASVSPSAQFVPKKRFYFYQHQLDFFADDQIRLTPNLSLSFGLRYTFTESLKEKDNQFAFFDFSTGELVYPKGSRDFSQFDPFIPFPFRKDGPNSLFDMPKGNFQPRLAIAWSPGSKTVVRTGFAIYYASPSVNNVTPMVEIPPYIITGQRNVTPLFPQDAFKLSDPIIGGADPARAFSHPSFQLGEFNLKTPKVTMWNLDIQRALTSRMTASLGYVGNVGKHLNSITRPNAPPPGPGPLDPRRPYPLIGRIIAVTWNGISNYNALQANLTNRFSNGLMFTASYAWGKSLGTIDDLVGSGASGTGGPLQTAGNQKALDYGRSYFDYRHIFKSSFIYELPFGRGKKFLSGTHPVTSSLLGGWQVSGIVSLQSGQAFSPSGGGDLNAERSSRPDRICSGQLEGSQRTLDRDFDTSCFVNHKPFVDGTSGRNILTQRPYKNLDLAISRSFKLPITEATRLQLRVEAFNATNTPFFALPNSSCCGSPNFGKITATERENRVVQIGAKVLF